MFITGMHRSGTSATANMAVTLGMRQSSEVLPAHLFNPAGHFESLQLFYANEQILSTLGYQWNIPPQNRLNEQEINQIRKCGLLTQLREQFQDKSTKRNWCDKDPRLALTLPIWDQILLRKVPVIACIRNPSEVASSLRLREGMPFEYGVMLWRYYNQNLRKSCQGRPAIVIDYEIDLKNNASSAAKKILSFAEHQGYTVDPERIDDAVSTFQKAYQRNDAAREQESLHEQSRRLAHAIDTYREIRELPPNMWPKQLETSEQIVEEDAQWLAFYRESSIQDHRQIVQNAYLVGTHNETRSTKEAQDDSQEQERQKHLQGRWDRLMRILRGY
jgi:hypothetical protein